MSSKGRLIILSAPSGTGKTTVVKRLMAARPQLLHSVSYTTRAKRPAEIHGQDYYFVDSETFQKMIETDSFAEWAQVHGCYYGTPRKPLENAMRQGQDVLLDIDVQGSLNLQDQYPGQTVSIFLLPPSEEELEKRLSGRGTDTPEVRKRRLENAKQEMTFQQRYDHRIVNDDLQVACEKILAILERGVD